MIEEILCVVRRQIRSIVNLCEHFRVRRFVQKESIETILKGHWGFNSWVRIITLKLEILILEVEDRLYIGVDTHLWQGTRSTRELLIYLLEVVEIEVCITQSVDELASLQATNLRHHHCK